MQLMLFWCRLDTSRGLHFPFGRNFLSPCVLSCVFPECLVELAQTQIVAALHLASTTSLFVIACKTLYQVVFVWVLCIAEYSEV